MNIKKCGKIQGTTVFLVLVFLLVSMLVFDSTMRRGAPTLDVSIEELVLEDNHFSLTASQGGNSGRSFRHSSYEIEGDALYVTLFSGLVYGGFRADRMRVDIRGSELNPVRLVYLRNGTAAKLLYTK